MPFALLGLAADADERAVKRAYAVRLKRQRPDDDPTGFQQLHEAYQACLALIERRRREAEEAFADEFDEEFADGFADEADDRSAMGGIRPPLPQAGERVEPLPVPTVAAMADEDAAAAADAGDDPSTFQFAGFMEELLQLMRDGTPRALMQWLCARPELYSVQLKHALTVDVLRIAAEQDPPVPAPMLDTLASFFGLDDVGPSGWWLRERVARAREAAEWRARFQRLPLPRSVPREQSWVERKIDEELLRPRSRWRTALLLLGPWLLYRTRERIFELHRLGGRYATDAMNPQSRALYLELGNRVRPDRRRFALSAARTLLYSGAALVLARLFGADPALLVAPLGWLGAGLLASHALVAGWLQAVVALQERFGAWERELSTLGLLATGSAIACSALTNVPAWNALGYGLLGLAVWHALGRARVVTGMAMMFPLGVVEFAVREQVGGEPVGLLVPMLAVSAVVPLLLDRVLAWRSGLDPRVHAARPKPLRYLFAGLFAVGFAALVIYRLIKDGAIVIGG